jgi:hypothetical protein
MDKNKEITNNPITTVSKLFFVGKGDNTMFRILIQIQFGLLLIRIQEGENNQQKKKTAKKLCVVSCSFWGTGGFSCSLTALHRGLRMKKIWHFFKFLIIKNLDLNPYKDSPKSLVRIRIQ